MRGPFARMERSSGPGKAFKRARTSHADFMGKDEKAAEKIAEDAPFDVPSFDEKDFIRKELISFRSTLVLFGLSIAVAGLSFVIWRTNPNLNFFLQMLIALGLGFLLIRFLFKLAKIDFSQYKRKEWAGTYFLYFFFWLGFFLLLSNPPVTDAAAPQALLAASPAHQAAGQPIHMAAYLADNVGVATDSVRFCLHKVPTGQAPPPHYADLSAAEQTACAVAFEPQDGTPLWTYTFVPTQNGSYAWIVRAADERNQFAEENQTIDVGTPLKVDPPGPNDASQFVDRDDSFNVCAPPELRLRVVQYSINDGPFSNFRTDPDPDKKGCWKTDPRYPGWVRGAQSVVVRGIEQPTFFPKGLKLEGGTVVDPHGAWNVTVSNDIEDLNTVAEPQFKELQNKPAGQSPGLALPTVFVAILVGLAFLGRRRFDGRA